MTQDNTVTTRTKDLGTAIALLQKDITSKAKGGNYAANTATGIKRLVEQALTLLNNKKIVL